MKSAPGALMRILRVQMFVSMLGETRESSGGWAQRLDSRPDRHPRTGGRPWLDEGASDEIGAATFDREEAIGVEEDQVLAQVDLGLHTLNKFLNPQYDHRAGRWSWQDD